LIQNIYEDNNINEAKAFAVEINFENGTDQKTQTKHREKNLDENDGIGRYLTETKDPKDSA